ncbi:MAG: nitronate monooxygenase [Lachnospiraceae bacterium]|nr:nitronate monooxygenase [Lachnospiraceae bacterium]
MKGIKVGNKISKYPIIQGGMGVGVSMHRLAGNVSKEGGIGIISTADIGYQEEDFAKTPMKANLRAIGKEIKKAREIAGEDKIIGVNIMVALKNYSEIVKECVKQKIDLIISGAGLPIELPEYVKGSTTKIAPIVSSLRSCKLIVKQWMKKYNYVPDMIVIEGPKAGGHLGFKNEELEGTSEPELENITIEVVDYIKEIEKETGKDIPVIAAGGIWDSKDIKKFMDLGAAGVQMATRFVATDECDASMEFKQAYVNAKKEDVKIIKSPVGLPGRAIKNNFIKQVEKEKCKIDRCYSCIKTCNLMTTPYCITKALINSVKGETDNGLIFCGSNVSRIKEIVSVHNLMQELVCEL